MQHNGRAVRGREAIMRDSNNLSRAAKLAGAAGIVAMGFVAIVAMAAKAPPYLPLNVHAGEKAPDFALPSASGDTVKLSQFAGRNVLLDFYEGYW